MKTQFYKSVSVKERLPAENVLIPFKSKHGPIIQTGFLSRDGYFVTDTHEYKLEEVEYWLEATDVLEPKEFTQNILANVVNSLGKEEARALVEKICEKFDLLPEECLNPKLNKLSNSTFLIKAISLLADNHLIRKVTGPIKVRDYYQVENLVLSFYGLHRENGDDDVDVYYEGIHIASLNDPKRRIRQTIRKKINTQVDDGFGESEESLNAYQKVKGKYFKDLGFKDSEHAVLKMLKETSKFETLKALTRHFEAISNRSFLERVYMSELIAVKSLWQECPSCHGNGIIDRFLPTTGTGFTNICRTCQGHRIISGHTGRPPGVSTGTSTIVNT